MECAKKYIRIKHSADKVSYIHLRTSGYQTFKAVLEFEEQNIADFLHYFVW